MLLGVPSVLRLGVARAAHTACLSLAQQLAQEAAGALSPCLLRAGRELVGERRLRLLVLLLLEVVARRHGGVAAAAAAAASAGFLLGLELAG